MPEIGHTRCSYSSPHLRNRVIMHGLFKPPDLILVFPELERCEVPLEIEV